VCCCCHWVYNKFLLFSFPSSIDIWDGPAAAKKRGEKKKKESVVGYYRQRIERNERECT
jgi:hypothetical protein